jgi:hypothetical protein
MFETTLTPTMSDTLADLLIAALDIAPGGLPLPPLSVRLVTAMTQPIPTAMAAGLFTEAAFTGYVAQVAARPLVGPINLPNARGKGALANVTFLCSGAGAGPESIIGYAVTDAAQLNFYMAEIFPTPVNIVNAGDFLELSLVIPIMQFPTTEG